MFDLNCCLNPIRARALAIGSKERELCSLSLRQAWHQIFDPCPRLLSTFAPDGKSILNPFLQFAEAQRLPMDWSTHLQLLRWMQADQTLRPVLSSEIIKELIAACASRWAFTDLSDRQGIFIRTEGLSKEQAIVGWKCRSLKARRKVVLISVPDEPSFRFGTFISFVDTKESAQELTWTPFLQENFS